MMTLQLHLKLLSDATFGRGDGVMGLVDQEVEHDPKTGLPFMKRRTLKGLLVEECSNIFFALPKPDIFYDAARFLFGQPGSTRDDEAKLRVGNAQLPEELRREVRAGIASGGLREQEVLETLTTIRRQTAVDATSGTPDEGSLRAVRVVLRETTFSAPLHFRELPKDDAKGLLAACVIGLRRAGTTRNRGRGRVQACLYEDTEDVTAMYFETFEKKVRDESH